MHIPYHDLVPSNFPADIEILGQCNLVEHDYSWKKLYNFLLPFQGLRFEHNQRLLILDHDTDYYPSESSVGNNLYNLIKLISELDISTDHIVILTGSYGLEKDVKFLCDRLNLSYPKVIEFSQWYDFPQEIKEKQYFQIRPSHLYICLNYKPRVHRMILFSMLHDKNLLSQGIVSWHAPNDIKIANDHAPTDNVSIDKINSANFRTTEPFTRINEDLNLCERSAKLLKQHFHTLNTTSKHPLITGQANELATRWSGDFFDHALLYVITETVGQYPYPYLSEKTWKAMTLKKPFLLLGAKHSLQQLKKLGFRTFDSIWDESYDSAPTLFQRANLITDTLANLSMKDWDEIIQQCQDIVEHNFYNLDQLQKNHLSQLKTI